MNLLSLLERVPVSIATEMPGFTSFGTRLAANCRTRGTNDATMRKDIMGVKRADKRRIDELRLEVEEEKSFRKKLVRSRLKWTGHMDRMGD